MNKLIKILFNPRFRIEEMEQSRLVHGCKYKISKMIFDYGERNYPMKAIGYVKDQTKGQVVEVSWNQFGECMADGNREKMYDMVRPTRRRFGIEAPFLIGILGIIFILMYIIICE